MQKFDSPFGHVEVLERTEKVGLSILVIYLGKEIKQHFHKKTREVEVVLEGELNSGGRKFKEGDVLVWEKNKVHGYRNDTDKNAKVLCITILPYDEKDVFEV